MKIPKGELCIRQFLNSIKNVYLNNNYQDSQTSFEYFEQSNFILTKVLDKTELQFYFFFNSFLLYKQPECNSGGHKTIRKISYFGELFFFSFGGGTKGRLHCFHGPLINCHSN